MDRVMIHSNYRAAYLIETSIYKYFWVGITILAKSTPMTCSQMAACPGAAIADAMFRGHEHGSWRETDGAVEGWERCPPGRSSLVMLGRGGSVIYWLRLGAVRRHRCSANYAGQQGLISHTHPPIIAKSTW